MEQLKILGIQVSDRIKEAGRTQKILSKHASNIRTRLGFHELNEAVCSRKGLIVLELCGEQESRDQLEKELKGIEGLTVKEMVFQL